MADPADARRRAEEYLRFWGHHESEGIEILRALLAAEPEAVVCDGHGETYDEVYRDRERLRESVEIERDGQRSMVRALAEIHRLSRLDVAISLASDAPSPARDEVREAAEGALGVLTDLAESAAYWSEYDVPLGIVSRVDFAKARLAAALAAKGGA